MKYYLPLLLASVVFTSLSASADRIAHFPMEASVSEKIKESVSGSEFMVSGRFAPENVAGAVGKALRFDGFSSFVKGDLKKLGTNTEQNLTVSMWVAPETYPIIIPDTPTDQKISLASTLNEASKSGWSFSLGYTGKYSFECFSGGWKISVEASDLLPCYEWSHLVAVADGASKKVSLYRNGVKVGEAKSMGSVDNSSTSFVIGKSADDLKIGMFITSAFNGIIDEIEVFNTPLSAAEIASAKAECEPDLIVSESRFATDVMRPRYHGMPAANWTNESHGMYYSGGRYHLFFQKNANGPYMSRLHWGHISSENLYDWREERIAIMPGDSYDIKGCWSGCVFADEEITGGKPNIIYTGVDYARAMISQAVPEDDDLLIWKKVDNNPIINGRPGGLSDDFRDPYFFRNGNDAYIIVGSQKGGLGTTTLHQYNPATKHWSNDGRTFFSAASASEDGTFWEMPNVTPMGNGKFLFTVTPIGTSQGVRTLYRVGTVDENGQFVPDAGFESPKTVELTSRHGYGLLSPTIYQHEGKTIALGIVPDKISSAENYNLGWAHCYSLPREWSLDAKGNLIQKPFSGLREMRAEGGFSRSGFELNGTLALGDVKGREAEILGVFTAGSAPFGFRFFKNAGSEATLTVNPATNSVTVDFTGLRRTVNDGGAYDGIYTCTLPETVKAGEEYKINLFIDHSILDIFVNDKWATSIRVFPVSAGDDEIEAFADASTHVKSLEAWKLTKSNSGSGITLPTVDPDNGSKLLSVCDLQGRLLKHNVTPEEATEGLPSGIYIIGTKKVVIY